MSQDTDKTRHTPVLSQLGLVLFRADMQWRLRLLSNSWTSQFGHARDQSLQRSLLDFIHPDDIPRIEHTLDTMYNDDLSTSSTVVRVIDAEHTARWCHCDLSAERNGGIMLGVSGSFRPTELPEEPLPEVPKTAEIIFEDGAQDQLWARMAGGLAHDINNMLQGIMSASELLAEHVPPGHLDQELYTIIESSGGRMSALIKQLVASARVGEFSPEEIQLEPVIEGAIRLSGLNDRQDITKKIDLRQSAHFVRADHAQLLQAILELLHNSVDAMRDGGTLRVKGQLYQNNHGSTPTDTAKGLAPGMYYRLMISDTGQGMTEEVMQQSFEPYFTTKEMRRGMGLSVARGTVLRHDGSMRIRSTPGKGTTITILLPLLDRSESGDDQTQRLRIMSGNGIRALVIDDEPNVRNIMRRILNRSKFDVTVAATGEEAIAMLEAGIDFDVYLVDYIMPGLSGDQLIERIKELEPTAKIMICTGYDMRHDKTPEHTERILKKPFTATELIHGIFRVLNE